MEVGSEADGTDIAEMASNSEYVGGSTSWRKPRSMSVVGAMAMGSPVVRFGSVVLLHQRYVAIQYDGCLLIIVFEVTQYSMKHLYLML